MELKSKNGWKILADWTVKNGNTVAISDVIHRSKKSKYNGEKMNNSKAAANIFVKNKSGLIKCWKGKRKVETLKKQTNISIKSIWQWQFKKGLN